MRFLLDTNTCIDVIRHHATVVNRLTPVAPEECKEVMGFSGERLGTDVRTPAAAKRIGDDQWANGSAGIARSMRRSGKSGRDLSAAKSGSVDSGAISTDPVRLARRSHSSDRPA
jgi:hypothetical protein